jgi:ribosome-binding ATPase YchF (GTP1/OBG family)
MVLIAAVVAGSDGCKSTGKLSKKERKAQIEAAKKELTAIINGTSTKSLEQQEKYISDIANKNYNDADLNALLVQATQKVKKAFAERDTLRQQQIDEAKAALFDLLQNKDNKSADEMESELNLIKAKYKNLNDEEVSDLYTRIEKQIASMRSTGNIPLKTKLETNFQSIADAGKSGNLTQAAALIKSTLPLFASDDTPVLIIIAKDGTLIDYDKPTTIQRYLNFLKDQKTSRNNVDSYLLDNNGKIKELDLIKK